jgi:hypothetical protein
LLRSKESGVRLTYFFLIIVITTIAVVSIKSRIIHVGNSAIEVMGDVGGDVVGGMIGLEDADTLEVSDGVGADVFEGDGVDVCVAEGVGESCGP